MGLGRRQQRADELRFRMEAAWISTNRSVAERLHLLTTRLLRQDATQQLRVLRERLSAAENRMLRAHQGALHNETVRVHGLTRQLEALSPLAVLNRGYALVFDEAGKLVKSASNVSLHQRLTTRLAEGSLRSQVTELNPKERPEL